MGRADKPALLERFGRLVEPFLSQSAAAGALLTLHAATSPDAVGGVMYGPDGFLELKGAVSLAKIVPRAEDKATRLRL